MTGKRDLVAAARDPLATKPRVSGPTESPAKGLGKVLGFVGAFALGLVAGVALARLKL